MQAHEEMENKTHRNFEPQVSILKSPINKEMMNVEGLVARGAPWETITTRAVTNSQLIN